MLLLAASDAAAKWLVERFSPFQILFVRSLIALPLAVAGVWVLAGAAALRSRSPGVHALRNLLMVCAAGAFIGALAGLPLAEATALWFVAPLFVVLLGALLLGERITRAGAAALVVGLAGMMLILRPGTAAFDPAALLAIGGAVLYALAMVSARWIDARDSIWTILVSTPAFGALYTSFTLLQDWPTAQEGDVAAFAIMAVCGTAGITLLTQSFRLGSVGVVAPFEYTVLLWASLLGWMLWGSVPSVWVYAGAALIVGSSLALLWRERAALKAPSAPSAAG